MPDETSDLALIAAKKAEVNSSLTQVNMRISAGSDELEDLEEELNKLKDDMKKLEFAEMLCRGEEIPPPQFLTDVLGSNAEKLVAFAQNSMKEYRKDLPDFKKDRSDFLKILADVRKSGFTATLLVQLLNRL